MAEDFNSLLALLRRTTDNDGWLQPLLADPDSAAVLGAYVQIFARLGISIPHNIAQGTLSQASGGSPGTASITIKRSSGSTTGTIPQGYVFRDARGCQAILQLAVAVTTQTTLVLPVQTLRQTELVNTEDDPGFAVDPSSPPIASSGAGGVLMAPVAVVTIVVTAGANLGFMSFTWAINNGPPSAPVLTPNVVSYAFPVPGTLIVLTFASGTYDVGDTWTVNADGTVTAAVNGSGVMTQTAGVDGTTFEVASSTQILGGAADYLSVHGKERGVLRQPGEQTDAYRARIRNIPDAVSPIAIALTVQQAVQKYGLPPFMVLEPFRDQATPALKSFYGLGSFDGMAVDVDFLDDPASGVTILDRRTMTAYLLIQAQGLVGDPGQFAMFLDDDAFCDDPVLGYVEATDVFPPQTTAALMAMIQDVTVKHAGGVNFDVFLEPNQLEIGSGSSSSASTTLVITLTPPAGKIWYVNAIWAGHDSASPVAGATHEVHADLEDGHQLITSPYGGTDTQSIPPPSQRVTQIRGYITSDGTHLVHLVVAVEVVEMAL